MGSHPAKKQKLIYPRQNHGADGFLLRWTGEGSSPMWMSTQKSKNKVHGCHPVFFSCKEVGVFFTRILSFDGIKSGKFLAI